MPRSPSKTQCLQFAQVKARRAATNALMEYRGNIRVLCRIRSPDLNTSSSTSSDASGSGGAESSFHDGPSGVSVDDSGNEVLVFHPKTERTQKWPFPVVFPIGASQEEVYSQVEPMVQSVLDGYHAAIFAYGQVRHAHENLRNAQALLDLLVPSCICSLPFCCVTCKRTKHLPCLHNSEVRKEKIVTSLLLPDGSLVNILFAIRIKTDGRGEDLHYGRLRWFFLGRPATAGRGAAAGSQSAARCVPPQLL